MQELCNENEENDVENLNCLKLEIQKISYDIKNQAKITNYLNKLKIYQ